MMKIENRKISFVLVVAVALILLARNTNALSLGISPSEKTVELTENQGGVVYFAISQNSGETETVDITVDADWVNPEVESFDLASGEQKYLKFTIDPLQIGTYTASVKASTSISPAMRTSVLATLTVTVSAETQTPEEGADIEDANAAITRAQNAISEASSSGSDTSSAENILTTALEEFDNGNYANAERLANLAYSTAASSTQQASETKMFLDPIMLAFIVIGLGATVVLAVLIYEVAKSRGSKKTLSKDQSRKCPRCGEKSFLAYDGTFISNFRCSKCGYSELRDKHHSF